MPNTLHPYACGILAFHYTFHPNKYHKRQKQHYRPTPIFRATTPQLRKPTFRLKKKRSHPPRFSKKILALPLSKLKRARERGPTEKMRFRGSPLVLAVRFPDAALARAQASGSITGAARPRNYRQSRPGYSRVMDCRE